MSGGRWKRYHEPRFLRNERKIIEEQLQITIRNLQNKDSNQPEGFQQQERRNEQWTVDPFWETDRPQSPQISTTNDNTPPPGQQQWTPMEEGEIGSGSEQDPSVLDVPAINWAKYVGVKSVQYIKMGHAPRVEAIEQNNWDLGNAVRETEEQFATDLQLLMTEFTNDPSLLKTTLVCLERQQHDNIPEEYSIYKKKLSSRYGLVFSEDKIIVPKNLRTTIISLLHKSHPAIKKMSMAARHFWWPRIIEAMQKKCDNCVPCKVAGKSIKPNINQIPMLNKPNEEIQLDFIGPITENNRRFYILLSMDRFSKWPAASFCKSTENQTAVKFLKQYVNLNGIPKTVRTDKATAFASRSFKEFCKEHRIKLIYGTPYIHTPTGLVEQGGRTLKEFLLANIKAGENFGKALDMALNVMRKTPLTRLNNSAFELHYGREPNTEISNLFNIDALKKLTKTCISAKPDTLQVYSLNGAGGVADQLPMKQKKGAKGVSNYLFLFHKFFTNTTGFTKIWQCLFGKKTQLAISGTNYTVTTADNKILHRKNISKPVSEITQEPNNRGTGPRGPDGRFTKSPRTFNIHDPDSESEATEPESPVVVTPKKSGTFGRGRPLKLVRNRISSTSSGGSSPTVQSQTTFGPMTIVTENMTTEAVDRAIEDAREADTEIHLKDFNGKVSHIL